ncbi:MAG: radical SAM protein [Acidobacteria bacterium]|nr:radical SAM protein [Acidobacteriota bacterium]
MANIESQNLFPILGQQRPTGVARMADESEWLDAGHDVEFRSLGVRTVMNKVVSKRMAWMAWGINPYRGCEFGCRYCYARYTHEFMELRDPEEFERKVFIKQNAAWLLEQELRKLERRGALHEEIAIGTATDPWQPIERRERVTRSLLEVFSHHRGLTIGVVTKSTLIERDLDLLRAIDARNTLVVHITITTPDVELARKLEPRAPRPDLRFRTVRRLREAGIRAGILNSPLLPGITDTPAAIDEMARRAARVDACFFSANPLFLKPCSRPTYFRFIQEHFPQLQQDYAERFREMDFAARPYRERMRALVAAACRKHGLQKRMSGELSTARKPAVREDFIQQQLRFG